MDDEQAPLGTADQPLDIRPFADAVHRIEELDTTAVREVLSAPGGSYKWPRYRVNEIGLEWRRWRLRQLLGIDEQCAVSITQFERLAVSLGMPSSQSQRACAPPYADDPRRRVSYDEMFPQGAVVPRAMRDRVLHHSRDGVDSEAYTALLRQCGRRRSEYLARLGDTERSWHIPDLLSPGMLRDCRRDAARMRPPVDSAYGGGRVHGWDIHYDVLNSRSHTMYLGEGPAIIALHEDPEVIAAISARMGRTMYPTRCTYLPYRKGDYLGVHTDQPNCEVSVLFTIDGEPGPLRSYFEVTTHDPVTLDRWVQEQGNLPDGGEDYTYQRAEGFALTGRVVPHARPTQTEYALIGALFYSGVV